MTILQLLSSTKWLSTKFQSSMTIFHYKKVKMQNIPNFCFKIGMDFFKFQSSSVSIFVKVFISVIRSYHSDMEYHVTLNTLFGIIEKI